jgi:hyperosmotically inducible protein
MENVMLRYLFNAVIIGFMGVLVGCQGSTPNNYSNNYSNNNRFNSSLPSREVTLAQSVQDALMRSNDPVLSQVRVQQTNQNTVSLSGYVKKIRQSDVAEQIARQVPGVQNLDNHLIVRQ